MFYVELEDEIEWSDIKIGNEIKQKLRKIKASSREDWLMLDFCREIETRTECILLRLLKLKPDENEGKK